MRSRLTRSRSTPGRQNGQVLPLVVASMVALCTFVGLVIDLGYAYHVKRELQAASDAAVLAGAAELPDPAAAYAAAHSYGASAGAKNEIDGQTVTESIAVNCDIGPRFCSPANTVEITATTEVPTFFLRAIGLGSIKQTVHAQACSPCGAKPLDIMVGLDRSGSMQQPAAKIAQAKDGIRAFLGSLDPTGDRVGLTVFAPAPGGDPCAAVPANPYDNPAAAYNLAPLSSDFGTRVDTATQLNVSSAIMSDLGCLVTGGATAYASAIDAAAAELASNGRAEAQKVIVLLSDGAANNGPRYLPATSRYRTNPCGQAIDSANAAKSAGVLVYSIAYDLAVSGSEWCRSENTGSPEQPQIRATAALQAIASPGDYYAQPQPADLTGIFLAISADLARGTARLSQ